MSIVDIASIVALIGSLSAVILALRKAPHEKRSLDASAAKTYQETAQLAAEHANRLETRIIVLEEKTAEQDDRIHALEIENLNLKEWAARLVNQVLSLGGTPVMMHVPGDPPTKPRGKNARTG